jgi:hypothetical protein
MQNFRDYLRAYLTHVRTHGWMKALGFALLWVAGMFVPAGARTFVHLPDWVAFSWMFGWAIGGYILAPYGMWKQQRAASINSVLPEADSR